MTELANEEKKRLIKRVRRLSRQDTLRVATEALLNEGEIPVHLIGSLIDTVTLEDCRRCLTAMMLLQNIEVPERHCDRLRIRTEAILRHDNVSAAKRFTRATWNVFGRGCVALVLGIMFWIIALSIEPPGDSSLTAMDFLALIFFGALTGLFLLMALFAPIWSPFIDKSRSDKIRSEAAALLGRIGNVDSVIALAKASREAGVQEASSIALLELLPAVHEDHYPEVSRLLTPALVGTFSYTSSRLLREVLDALARAGNGSAVTPVERLLKVSTSAKTKEAANRALVQLRARLEAEQNAERLLRPTSAPGENLLRPATHSETPQEQLLRPAAE
jgi:hypothetical protein